MYFHPLTPTLSLKGRGVGEKARGVILCIVRRSQKKKLEYE